MFILQNAEAVSQASRLAGIQKLGDGDLEVRSHAVHVGNCRRFLKGWLNTAPISSKPVTIQRFLKNYQTLLESVARNPDEFVATLSLLATDERRHLIEELNQTAVTYAEKDFGLHELVEIQAKKAPSRIAVSFENGQISYCELDERAYQLANYLKACGVGADSLVGVLLERSSEMVVALLAILKAGGAYVPLDPSFPRNRIAAWSRTVGFARCSRTAVSTMRLRRARKSSCGSIPMPGKSRKKAACWRPSKSMPASSPTFSTLPVPPASPRVWRFRTRLSLISCCPCAASRVFRQKTSCWRSPRSRSTSPASSCTCR